MSGFFEPFLYLPDFAMGAEDRECSLTLVRANFSRMHQIHGPGGDRFSGHERVDQLDVNTPKVLDECDQIGHQFATSQIAKREAAPASVVFSSS